MPACLRTRKVRRGIGLVAAAARWHRLPSAVERGHLAGNDPGPAGVHPSDCSIIRCWRVDGSRAAGASRVALSSIQMARLASSIVALLVAVSPILGQTCVLRCHRDVACHRAVGSTDAEASCHHSARAPIRSIMPAGGACESVPSSLPALGPASADASARALGAPAVAVATTDVVALPAATTIGFAAPPGTRVPTSLPTPIPLRL